jgi:putative DNA primase/helicase
MSDWLMRWFGYCLTGDTSTPFFVNFHGKGRNGKGTLLHVMAQIFGDYARTIPDEVVIEDSRAGNIKHAYAALKGVRLAVAGDVKAGRINISEIKKITGKDEIEGERKYHDSFPFRPICKITLASNHKLSLPETGPAVSRVRFIPFKFSARGKEDAGLEDKILKEAPQILAWLIREAGEYLKNPGPGGFPPCAAIDRATADYIAGEDVIQQFLDDRMTTKDAGARIGATDLYKAYKKWVFESEGKAMSLTAFGRRMSGKGLEKVKSHGIFCYEGIREKGIYD